MHALAFAWSDTERNEAAWESPEDHQYTLGWVEACGRALEQANAHRWAGATLTVDAYVKPCPLGCVDDDGTPMAPGTCGEPDERKFSVTVEDDTLRYSWHVV